MHWTINMVCDFSFIHSFLLIRDAEAHEELIGTEPQLNECARGEDQRMSIKLVHWKVNEMVRSSFRDTTTLPMLVPAERC